MPFSSWTAGLFRLSLKTADKCVTLVLTIYIAQTNLVLRPWCHAKLVSMSASVSPLNQTAKYTGWVITTWFVHCAVVISPILSALNLCLEAPFLKSLFHQLKVPTLMKATADDENPCPGYLFQEIGSILWQLLLWFSQQLRLLNIIWTCDSHDSSLGW